MSGRRQMKPWEVVATLLTAKQLYAQRVVADDGAAFWVGVIRCPRTGKDITLENVRSIQIEHWPVRHKHQGPVSPDNAIISLSEGHKVQTKREQKADRKERRVKAKALPKAEREVPLHKRRYRWKKKLDGSVVRVRTR